jgi:hypothetical protein
MYCFLQIDLTSHLFFVYYKQQSSLGVPRAEEDFSMPNKLYPADVLEQAQSVLAAWGEIDSQLVFGTLSHSALESDIMQARQTLSQMEALEAQLTNLRNQRDAQN